MGNTEKNIQSLQELATLLLDKLKDNQTNLTLDFQNLAVKGPGPQGAPGEWKLHGKISLTAKNSD